MTSSNALKCVVSRDSRTTQILIITTRLAEIGSAMQRVFCLLSAFIFSQIKIGDFTNV
jgi:hypothetical protein